MMNIWKDRAWGPMLLKKVPEPFDSDKHIFEIKFDGIRAIIFASPKRVVIQSRNKKDITHLFPEMQEIKTIVKTNVIFDGEIVVLESGVSSFAKVQERMHVKSSSKISMEIKNNPSCFMTFDILYEGAKDLRNIPLIKRKEYLDKYPDTDYFIKTKYFHKKGIKLFKEVQKLGLEGIVAKDMQGKYYINKRTNDFIKIKNIQRDEFVIGGYILKKNSILSVALGEQINGKLHYCGQVSIGSKKKIHKDILKEKKAQNPFCRF